LITNKSLFAASSWSHLHLLIEDARSSEHTIHTVLTSFFCTTGEEPGRHAEQDYCAGGVAMTGGFVWGEGTR
jgi:hypothetical protein